MKDAGTKELAALQSTFGLQELSFMSIKHLVMFCSDHTNRTDNASKCDRIKYR